MTNDAEARTAVDHAIDEVAHAMTVGPVPQLRWHVAERLDAHGWTVRWWQPALLMMAIFVAAIVMWPSHEVDVQHSVQEHPAPIIPAPQPTPVGEHRLPDRIAPMVRTVRPPRSSTRVRNTSLDDTRSLPPIQVAPIVIDTLDVEPAPSVEMADMPRLALEPLDIQLLPRSNR
jgi:hypothetical protein